MTPIGHVYFAGPPSAEAIKIGWSKNPASAVHENGNRWCWLGLTLFGTIDCYSGVDAGTHSRGLERSLHAAFSDAKIRNEWFFPVDDLLELIRFSSTSQIDAPAARAWLRERRGAA